MGKFKMAANMATQANPINGHNFCPRADSLMKLVAKYRFSQISNATKYIRIVPSMSKWVNPRWLPTWPPKSIDGHTFH